MYTDQYWDAIFKGASKPTLFESVFKGLVSVLMVMGGEYTMFAVVLQLATGGDEDRAKKAEKPADALAKGAVEVAKGAFEQDEKNLDADEQELNQQFKLQYLQDLQQQCMDARHYIDDTCSDLEAVVDAASASEAQSAADNAKKRWAALIGVAPPYKSDSSEKFMGLFRLG